MKSVIYKIRYFICALSLLFTIKGTAQNYASCTMSGNTVATSLFSTTGGAITSIQTGRDFNLNLTLPGQNGCNGEYEVSVITTPNLMQGAPPELNQYPFLNTDILQPNLYTNQITIPSTGQGIQISIPFKFRPGVTCNGETGTFTITIKLKCATGPDITCTLTVSLTAIAQNDWSVEKKWVWGDLRGGDIVWDIIIKNNNSTPGIGDYNIDYPTLKDFVSSGTIVSVVHYSGNGALYGIVGLGTANVQWQTGLIESWQNSMSNPLVYRVTTRSCAIAGTVVKNCVNIYGPLGFHPTNLGQLPCGTINNATPICAEKTLVEGISTLANFSKTLTYGIPPNTNLNYATGCEAEYTITVSNGGNVGLNAINISDNFPAGINVTHVSVSSTGTNMNYTSNWGNGNTAVPQTFTGSYPSFNLTTTSGVILGGTIIIRIRFRITAAAGTSIENCAELRYTGTDNGTGSGVWICGVYYPLSQQTPPKQCVKFTVQNAAPKIGISKCIPGGQQTFLVGQPIPFRIVIYNHGSAPYTGNLSDFLGPSAQNLQLVGGLTYSHGIGYFNPYSTTPGCVNPIDLSSPSSGWTVPALTTTTQSITGVINNMPGNCDLDKAYYLIIDFNALILPQSFGNYQNTVTLGTNNATCLYNIMRVAKIVTTKSANPEFVEPGQAFNFTVNVLNAGSVALNNIRIQDALPTSCVTYNNCNAAKIDVSGNATSIAPPSHVAPNFIFPVGFTLQPGEAIRLTIMVTRNANDQGAQCCNPLAKGMGTPIDAAQMEISDEQGPACVKSGLCCDIPNFNVTFWTNHINGAIVPAFWITSGPVPVQEIEISLMDYHVQYSNPECKPLSLNNLFGHIQPFVGTYGGNWNFNSIPGAVGALPPLLPLQTVVSPVNNILTWSGTDPISLTGFNGIVGVNFIAPGIVNLDCCSGTVYYCFKVRVKDVNCNVCEKIVCGSSAIPRRRIIPWRSIEAKDKYEIQSLKNNEKPLQKIDESKGQNNFGLNPGGLNSSMPKKKSN